MQPTSSYSAITIIADSNISHLGDYFNQQILNHQVTLITMAGRDITAEVLATHQPQALLVRSVTPVNEGLLADNNSVVFVGSATIGTDHIDEDYLASRRIHFANASGCSKHSVAQYVVTAILSMLQKNAPSQSEHLSPFSDTVTDLEPIKTTKPIEPIKSIEPIKPKTQLTLGIIGLGNIGSTLAKYAEDLGWQVLGYDPFVEQSQLNNACFEQLLMQSDVVSLHTPLTTTSQSEFPTHHLIDDTALALMKPSTILINSARGKIIKESALLADMAKTSRSVVLDVFEYEPVVSAELLDSLAIATPHIAGYTLEGKLRGTQMVYDSFCQCFGLEIRQDLAKLLPTNPYRWQSLLNQLNPWQVSKVQLKSFYDIDKDSASLRHALDSSQQCVHGQDFDLLRKNYPLRREWMV